jgi:release factor glutamine methyltransferase
LPARLRQQTVKRTIFVAKQAVAMDEAEHVSAVRRRGTTTFLGVELAVLPDALVPREETELLGRTALELIHGLGRPARVVDMCCGAGNLACALAALSPDARVWASDLTDGAVHNARVNVEKLGLSDRVIIAQGDLFAPLETVGLQGTINLIVCNPPYISTGRLEKDRGHLLEHEPREAFDGGPYGLSIHQRVIAAAPDYLAPGGWLAFEIGEGQDRQLDLLFKRARRFAQAEARRDAAGAVRVMLAQMD